MLHSHFASPLNQGPNTLIQLGKDAFNATIEVGMRIEYINRMLLQKAVLETQNEVTISMDMVVAVAVKPLAQEF